MSRFHHLSLPAALLALAALASSPARAARLSVVVDGLTPTSRHVVDALKRDLGEGNGLRVYDAKTVDFSNPVAKGRFLARVADADVVIPVGDSASRLISRELEDLKTFFVAAGGLSGSYLSQRQVGGILSYSPEETIRVAKVLLPRTKNISVLYTPGYGDVVGRMEAAARSAGITVTSYRVASPQEVGPAARQAAARSDLLWTVGDPLFTQDLIFAYLLQESLRLKKPLAAPLPSLVDKGALFCTVPDDGKMAELASAGLSRLLAENLEFPAGQRIQSAPEDGPVLVNRHLAEHLNIRIPASLRVGDKNAP